MKIEILEDFLASFPDKIAVDTDKIKAIVRETLAKEENEIYKKVTKHYRKVVDDIIIDCIAESVNQYIDSNPALGEEIRKVISKEIDEKVERYLGNGLIRQNVIQKQIDNKAYEYLRSDKINSDIEREIEQFIKERITDEAFVKAFYRVYDK